MAYTYSKIATYTVGSGGIPSISFLNIPQNYTDLVLKISARTTRASVTDAISLSLNGIAANQSCLYLQGAGDSSTSGTLSSFRALATGANATASTFGNSEFYIPNYTGSTFKSASSDGVTENNATESYIWPVANLWSNTAPITSIAITNLNSATFVQHSTFHLYGIKAEL